MPKEETVQYTFRIPSDLKTELERIARYQDRTLSRQLIAILRQYAKNNTEDN